MRRSRRSANGPPSGTRQAKLISRPCTAHAHRRAKVTVERERDTLSNLLTRGSDTLPISVLATDRRSCQPEIRLPTGNLWSRQQPESLTSTRVRSPAERELYPNVRIMLFYRSQSWGSIALADYLDLEF